LRLKEFEKKAIIETFKEVFKVGEKKIDVVFNIDKNRLIEKEANC